MTIIIMFLCGGKPPWAFLVSRVISILAAITAISVFLLPGSYTFDPGIFQAQ